MAAVVALRGELGVQEPLGGSRRSPEILDELAAAGIPARRSKAKLEELRHVRTPALFQSATEGWLLVRRIDRVGADVRGEAGPLRMSHAELWADSQGEHLEVMAKVPWGAGLARTTLDQAMKNRALALSMMVAALMGKLLALWASWMVARMVDSSGPGGNSIAIGVIAMAALGVAQAGLTFIWSRMGSAVIQVVKFNLAGDLLRRILRLPFSVVVGMNAGEVGVAMSNAGVYADLLSTILANHWVDVAQCLVGLVVAFFVSPLAGGVLVLFGVAILAVNIASAKQRADLISAGNRATTAQMDYLAEVLDGAVTVKTHGIEDLVVGRWHRLVAKEVELDQRSSVLGIRTSGLAAAVTRVFTLSILVISGYLVMAGHLGIGGMMLVIQVGMTQAVSLATLAGALPIAVVGVRPRLERIREITSQREVAPRLSGDRPVEGLVEVNEVAFRYPGMEGWVLEGLSFRVEPGGKHWLRTPSGSGKTTTLRLLAGLYEPERGSIAIDGVAPEQVGSGVLYLPQTIRLFSGSIMLNLRILSGISDSQTLREMAEQTGLGEFVATLPMGYETILQYSGGNLSGGQRQLIAMTAALASDKRVLLLDEAMANMDWHLRPRIASLKAFEGRTVIYASHDKFF